MHPIERPRIRLTVVAIAAITACLTLPPASVEAQERPASDDGQLARSEGSVLTGRVLSRADGRPVEGAVVRVRGAESAAVTDPEGHYRLADLPYGLHVLEVEELGGDTRLLPVVLRRGHVTRVTVRVAPEVVVMDEIEVTVNRGWRLEEAGFWERQRTGMGSYLTPAEIDRRDPQRTADLLSTMPGLNVGPAQYGYRALRMGRSAANRSCDPVLYVNGHLTVSQHVDDVHADDVLAVEVYRGPASLPARFHRNHGKSDCGAIVIWTKLREQ